MSVRASFFEKLRFNKGVLLLYLSLVVLVTSCSEIDKLLSQYERNSADSPATFFSTVRDVNVEVAYEPRAEPFTGDGFYHGYLWDFVEQNLKAAFSGRRHSVSVKVPKELADMKMIPGQGRERYTMRDILELAARYRDGRSGSSHADFMILFLDGLYVENGAVSTKVLGVSFSGTSVVAIFKPAELLASEGYQDTDLLPKYLEQSTIVHELGHTLGLVNNGVPLTSAHHDSAHGAHCTNTKCVMYYQNEGVADLRNFVKRFMFTGNLVVFGPECLRDFRSYHPD